MLPLDGQPNIKWLCEQKLIQDDTLHPGASFPTWEEVMDQAGVQGLRQTRLHINSTAAVILAALGGRGIILVRKALVQQDLNIGRLVQLFPENRWPINWSYYLVCAPQSLKRSEVRVFHDWILQDVRGKELSDGISGTI